MENLITEKSQDYELVDSGDGEKLERFGHLVLSRPDPQAIWPKQMPSIWHKADANFMRGKAQTGKWNKNSKFSENFKISLERLTFSLKLLPSKHVGVFPEQSQNWKWLQDLISKAVSDGKQVRVLNLFGYTGGASLACAKAGASVVHLDSSAWAVGIAQENARLSGLADRPIRFITDDARKFVEREVKRGGKYEIILLDPPVYGKGTKKEVWKIERDLLPLLSRLKSILSPEPLAVLLNGYSSGYSHIAYAQALSVLTGGLGGKMSSGELFIKESFGGPSRPNHSGGLLPAGIFARWEK